jgi:hypothetical protein
MDHGEPDHRFRLARAFLSEAADIGAWRVFVGRPAEWELFTKALQGIEGGTLLHATGKGLAALIPDPALGADSAEGWRRRRGLSGFEVEALR